MMTGCHFRCHWPSINDAFVFREKKVFIYIYSIIIISSLSSVGREKKFLEFLRSAQLDTRNWVISRRNGGTIAFSLSFSLLVTFFTPFLRPHYVALLHVYYTTDFVNMYLINKNCYYFNKMLISIFTSRRPPFLSRVETENFWQLLLSYYHPQNVIWIDHFINTTQSTTLYIVHL